MCSIFKIANQPSVCWPVLTPLKDVSHHLLSDVLEVAAVQVLRKSGGSSMTFPWLFRGFSMTGNRVAKESLQFGISDAIKYVYNIYIYIYMYKPFKWRLKLKKSIENGGGVISREPDALSRDLRTWLEGIAMGQNNPQQTS